MSKEMKDFLSQFMNQPAAPILEVIAPESPKKEPKPKVEKLSKPAKPAKVVREAPPKAKKALITEGVGEKLSAEDFLQSVNDKKYTFNQKKNLQIDDQLFAILNLLKQHENIKSIATFLNAIIEKYIEDNKDDLKQILSKNPLG
jgi:hypothetical protein